MDTQLSSKNVQFRFMHSSTKNIRRQNRSVRGAETEGGRENRKNVCHLRMKIWCSHVVRRRLKLPNTLIRKGKILKISFSSNSSSFKMLLLKKWNWANLYDESSVHIDCEEFIRRTYASNLRYSWEQWISRLKNTQIDIVLYRGAQRYWRLRGTTWDSGIHLPARTIISMFARSRVVCIQLRSKPLPGQYNSRKTEAYPSVTYEHTHRLNGHLNTLSSGPSQPSKNGGFKNTT